MRQPSRLLRKVGSHKSKHPRGGKKPMLPKSSVTTKMVFFVLVAVVPLTFAQSEDSGQTMRPVIRGRHAAVASMKA